MEGKKTMGLEDPDVVVETKDKTVKKKKLWEDSGYDDQPFYDEFRPFWGPGNKYKPWIYGE